LRTGIRTYPAILAACGLALGGCASKTTYDSFRPVRNAKVDMAYVNTEADFTRYRRLQVEEMGIYFPTHAAPDENDIALVRKAFRDAFIPRLKDYPIVDKPADDVLYVQASLVDLRNTAMDRLPQLSRQINEILEPGGLTFIIEMSDSKTKRVLLRAADTEKSVNLDLPDNGVVVPRDVTEAAEFWADLLGNFLDHNLRGGG